MPRVARFRIAEIGELCRQLRFASREMRAREMDAAERLVDDIEPDLNYPEEFVTFRITGYRPRTGDEPVTFVGAALVGDLVNLVQELSEALELPQDYHGRQACGLDDVARRLGVSIKTVRRYRRRGLVCHYVRGPAGARLVCFEDALDRFVARQADRVRRAKRFTRISAREQAEIVTEARRLRAAEEVSLNEAARRLAAARSRAHETIRGILQRHDRDADTPIFGAPGPIEERAARVIERAWRRGIPAARIGRRFGRTPSTIRRIVDRRRGQALRRLEITFVDLPTFDLADAEHVILAAPAVTERLDDLLPAADALALIAAAHEAPRHADPAESDALVAALNYLKRRARRALDDLPAWPHPAQLDRVETDLRWATRLKRRLVSRGFPAAVARIEQNLHRPLAEEPRDRISALLREAVRVVGDVVDDLDPGRGGRPERLIAWAMDRALARPDPPGDPDRAARARARHERPSIALSNLYAGLTPWDPLLEPSPAFVARVGTLPEPSREIVARHFGLGPTPPETRAEIAVAMGLTPTVVTRMLRKV
ncbi:MAG: helix-turn-helix domain-containing protein [Planctomycetes bacterium]|nr:helix-turn-helix domain-containing protein [Planctomycetota bacterium]